MSPPGHFCWSWLKVDSYLSGCNKRRGPAYIEVHLLDLLLARLPLPCWELVHSFSNGRVPCQLHRYLDTIPCPFIITDNNFITGLGAYIGTEFALADFGLWQWQNSMSCSIRVVVTKTVLSEGTDSRLVYKVGQICTRWPRWALVWHRHLFNWQIVLGRMLILMII